MRPTLCHEASARGYPEWEAAQNRLPRGSAGNRCPAGWADRYVIWGHSGTIRLVGTVPYDDGCPMGIREMTAVPLPDPGDPALDVAFAGWDWVFSHRGVYQAALAWKAWNIRWVHGMPTWASWLNGLPGGEGSQVFYPCASPWAEVWAVTDGRATIGLHPLIVGPVVRSLDERSEWAPGLIGERDGRYRGEQVPIGIRRGSVVEPVVVDGGWFTLGTRYENRRL